MKKNGMIALFRLIGTLGIIVTVIWLLIQFVEQVTLTAVLPVVGVYIAYKVFCVTLDFIKSLAKIAVIILIICLLFI